MSARTVLGVCLLVAACGGDDGGNARCARRDPAHRESPAPRAARHAARRTTSPRWPATATITVAPSTEPGATLEVGRPDDRSGPARRRGPRVHRGDRAGAAHANDHTHRNLALPASDGPLVRHDRLPLQAPCELRGRGRGRLHPRVAVSLRQPVPLSLEPDDGLAISLATHGASRPARHAVFPPMLTEAPAYQIAWSIDAYTELPLGMTTAGTAVSMWYRPTELAMAQAGGANLVAVFDWLEETIGPYRFGWQQGRHGQRQVGAPVRSAAWSTTRLWPHLVGRARRRGDQRATRPCTAGYGDGDPDRVLGGLRAGRRAPRPTSPAARSTWSHRRSARTCGGVRDRAERHQRHGEGLAAELQRDRHHPTTTWFTNAPYIPRRVLLSRASRSRSAPPCSTRPSRRSTRRTPARPRA